MASRGTRARAALRAPAAVEDNTRAERSSDDSGSNIRGHVSSPSEALLHGGARVGSFLLGRLAGRGNISPSAASPLKPASSVVALRSLWQDLKADEAQHQQDSEGCWTAVLQRLAFQVKVSRHLMRTHRCVLLLPLLLMAMLMAGGVVGLIAMRNYYKDYQHQVVVTMSASLAQNLAGAMKQAELLPEAVEVLVQQKPYLPNLLEELPDLVARLVSETKLAYNRAFILLEVAPYGVVRWNYPPHGNEGAIGMDLSVSAAWGPEVRQVLELGETMVAGPFKMIQGRLGVAVWHPIFLANVTRDVGWGAAGSALSAACSGHSDASVTAAAALPAGCGAVAGRLYNETSGVKWWGLVNVFMDFEVMLQEAQLTKLEGRGLRYTLSRREPGGGERVLYTSSNAAAGAHPHGRRHQVTSTVELPNANWTLTASSAAAHSLPSWFGPAVAAVVLVAVFSGGLLLVALLARLEADALLGKLMPKKVIQRLRRGQGYAESFQSVTVLFLDIVAYTSMTAGMSPMELVGMLSIVYAMYDRLIALHGCSKVDTIGDALMVVAGCPEREEPSRAAVRAAQLAHALLDATEIIMQQREEGKAPLQIRIGLHTGPVVAAIVGADVPKYSVFGDTVNVASRMESTSEPMRAHVSRATAELLQEAGGEHEFELQPRGVINVKGKGRMSTYWLKCPNSERGQRESVAAAASLALGPPPVGLYGDGSVRRSSQHGRVSSAGLRPHSTSNQTIGYGAFAPFSIARDASSRRHAQHHPHTLQGLPTIAAGGSMHSEIGSEPASPLPLAATHHGGRVGGLLSSSVGRPTGASGSSHRKASWLFEAMHSNISAATGSVLSGSRSRSLTLAAAARRNERLASSLQGMEGGDPGPFAEHRRHSTTAATTVTSAAPGHSSGPQPRRLPSESTQPSELSRRLTRSTNSKPEDIDMWRLQQAKAQAAAAAAASGSPRRPHLLRKLSEGEALQSPPHSPPALHTPHTHRRPTSGSRRPSRLMRSMTARRYEAGDAATEAEADASAAPRGPGADVLDRHLADNLPACMLPAPAPAVAEVTAAAAAAPGSSAQGSEADADVAVCQAAARASAHPEICITLMHA